MASETNNAPANTRRIRPWIAALLTFLGWGVGFYYARRTRAAIWWAVAGVVIGLLLGVGVLGYMLATHTAPVFISDPLGHFGL